MLVNFRSASTDDIFENEHTVALPPSSTTGKATTVCALTKDFIVTMQAVADLGVVSPINLAVGQNALILDFATSAADYKIAIPTCSLDGVRNEGAFDQASVIALEEEPFESYNDQAEGDIEE